MERINMFTLQGTMIDVIIDCDNMVFSSDTVEFRWNCDSAWFNLESERYNGSLRWKRLIY